MAKSFDKFTEDEMKTAMANSVDFVVMWLEHNKISAGSTANYNLYVAVQSAIRAEWEKAKEHSRKERLKLESLF